MKPQMKRLQYLGIAKSLEEALEDSFDAFDSMRDAYIIANQSFERKSDDIDPAVMAVGLQAQALGCMTLSCWLSAVSTVTNFRFHQVGEKYADLVRRAMDDIGIVIPDTMVL